MNYLLYNSLSSSLKGEEKAKEKADILSQRFPDLKLTNLVDLDHDAFVFNLKSDDNVLLAGGDGSLNHFINAIHGIDLPCPFYLVPNGTGNDFAKDNADKIDDDGLIRLNELLHNLPCVEVNGKAYRFFNGTGLGIDGDTCNEANHQKEKGKKKISYVKIGLDLILKNYQTTTATVEINGKTYTFNDVFMASSMYGKYFGGGILIAKHQDRANKKLTFFVAKAKGKIKTLLALNSVNNGKADKIPKTIQYFETEEVKVKFSTPHALQIDGEIIENVTEYRAYVVK